MKNLNSIAALKQYRPSAETCVYISGYYQPNDGGGGHYSWDAESQVDDNGGTVIASSLMPSGRWLHAHHGVGDFRTFGIMDDSTPADAALVAMVNDPTIEQIYAFNDLLFQRRHRFNRSGITLDFQNHHLSTQGIEPANRNDPFAAVLFFQGEIATQETLVTLTETVKEQTDIFPVGDSSAFTVGEWVAVQVNRLVGDAERELQKLVQITAIPDSQHVQVGYYNGWELGVGRILSWRKVKPVRDVTVKNLRFSGVGNDQYTGSHPLAFEFAVYANAVAIHATGSFWPVVMRRWNTHYLTQQCSLLNPPDTASGGVGYLTQQIYCLYGHVSDCHVSNARHLNDFTASAYCKVENCHADGQSAEKGPFVTHGQYEHDLTYTGNSGLMTFANSGVPWGESAKRINVRKHVCPWFVARSRVTDLTLEDVVVIANDAIPSSGMMWVNADGLQMRGCSADRVLRISQASQRSTRRNLIEGCHFALLDDGEPVVQASVSSAMTFRDTRFDGINGHSFASTAALSFVRCELNGGNGQGKVGVMADQLALQSCRINGGQLMLADSEVKQVDMTLLTLDNASLDFSTFNIAQGSSLVFAHNRLRNSTIVAQPAAGETVVWESNIVLGTAT